MPRTLILIAILMSLTCGAADLSTSAGSPSADVSVGYPTVALALAALQNKPGAEVATKGGWIIVSEPTIQTIWSFVPKENAAYPSVVKRTAAQSAGAVYIDMKVLCEAPKPACDQLVENFNSLNGDVRKAVQH